MFARSLADAAVDLSAQSIASFPLAHARYPLLVRPRTLGVTAHGTDRFTHLTTEPDRRRITPSIHPSYLLLCADAGLRICRQAACSQQGACRYLSEDGDWAQVSLRVRDADWVVSVRQGRGRAVARLDWSRWLR